MSLPGISSKKKLLLIIILWFVLMALIGYFIGSAKTGFDLPKISFGKKIFRTKKAIIVESISKTKKIDSKGGRISVVDKKGVKITLNIPPKALSQEAEIKLSPLEEPPLVNYDAGENSPGVLIDPVNIRFAIPGTLVFDFDPENDEVFTQPNIPVAGAPSQNQPSIVPPNDTDLTDDERGRRETAQIIHVGPNSAIVHTDSTTGNAGGNVYFTPSERNTESSEVQVEADGGGTYSYDSEVAKAEASVFPTPNRVISSGSKRHRYADLLTTSGRVPGRDIISESFQDLSLSLLLPFLCLRKGDSPISGLMYKISPAAIKVFAAVPITVPLIWHTILTELIR